MTKADEIELAWTVHEARRRGRGNLTPQDRDRLAEAQNWRCCYCGCRMDGNGRDSTAPTFEHVLPVSLGGAHDLSNTVVSCRLCNWTRGNQPLERFLRARAA